MLSFNVNKSICRGVIVTFIPPELGYCIPFINFQLGDDILQVASCLALEHYARSGGKTVNRIGCALELFTIQIDIDLAPVAVDSQLNIDAVSIIFLRAPM